MVRWSAVGLVWLVAELLPMVHPRMRVGLAQVPGFVDEYLRRQSKPGIFLGSPVSQDEAARFGKERQAYLEYFAAGDFSELDYDGVAPWLRID